MTGSFVPLTKILATAAFSIWSIALRTPEQLAMLLAAELLILAVTGVLLRQYKALAALTGFAVFLGVVQMLGGGTATSAIVAGLRMLCMTAIFVLLIDTTRLQDLTAALVTQCRIPYEYAFMFTAALRFVPDFMRESKIVREAQACRGLSTDGGFLKKMSSYGSVIQPLLLKSLGRSETMALSLELRGFGSDTHNFSAKVTPRAADYVAMAVMTAVTIGVLYLRYIQHA